MTYKKLEVKPLSKMKWRKLVYIRLREINSPRSLAVYLIMKNTDEGLGNDDELMALRCDPLDYLNHEDFFSAYEPTELVRKSTLLSLSTDPEQEAIKSFLASEEQCRESNRRIRTINPSWAVGEILHRAEKMIADILPDIDAEFLESLADSGGWGPGVTSSCKGKFLSEFNKIAAKPQCSPALHSVATALLKSSPAWSSLHQDVEIIPGNQVAFVPKDARTDRPIAVEPSMNSFFQKAIGRRIRRSLHKWGINLRSQETNQRLALLGSIDDSLSTIDLSSASDTVCIAIVERLLPSRWVSLLRLVRSENYTIDGDAWHTYHKWSSMGNGYTFELETLIFSSLVRSVTHELRSQLEWTVYGDDIIIDANCSELLIEVLSYCGFTVNKRKSFLRGPFRESCGEDFFLGHRVRPFYIKDIKGITPYIYANWLYQNRRRLTKSSYTYDALVSSIPKSRRFRVPYGSGLIGFEVDEIEAVLHPSIKAFGYDRWSVEGLVWVPHRLADRHVDGPAAVASHIRTLTARVSEDSFPLQVTARDAGFWVRKRVRVFSFP